MTHAVRSTKSYLELEDVTQDYGATKALNHVSLSVGMGEFVCLVGHSGCGKSTLLRVIAGVERAQSGRIRLNGVEVAGPKGQVEPEERRIGFMFQDYALFPHLNVRDNIMFGLKKLQREQARLHCEHIIGRLGLDHLAARFPHMLSGGEQQRVALARALAPQPHVLLMDEPFSNLDRGLRDGIRTETIAILRELGTTVVMVTHDPEEALSAGDRVILMRNGTIVQAGTSSDIYDRPASAYVADFFCTFNKIKTICKGGYAETVFGRFEARGYNDGEAITVYIRPQNLSLCGAGNGLNCTVLRKVLMGEIEQLELQTPSLSETLRIRSTTRSRLHSGDQVSVQVNSDAIFVF